ncbi:MAG: hypothetical protein DMD81_25095, partial [Candidatus Rokuibacteriota bacterium]
VIAEYGVSGSDENVADPTETVLLTIAQPYANHNGGMLAFGPDGFLYIGMGDGGSGNDPGNRAQNVDELLGKILRIDVDHPNGDIPYSSPPDNPFFGATPGRDEIYASGMRNPWRFSFDRATGDLYVGDGWRRFEGNHCTNLDGCDATGLTFPIAEYGHTGGRCSITGGYVYRGARSTLPGGTYVYGDYCTGELFTLAGGVQTVALDTSLNVSSFGEDEAGEVYVVGLGGTVDRITTSPPPPLPCSYSIAPNGQSFSDSGGTGSVSLSTTSDCGWLAASHAGWITITTATTGAGSAAIAYTVAPNPGSIPRNGTIAVAGQKFSVAQGVTCTFTIDPTSQPVASAGGDAGVDVTTPGGCPWTAKSNASWIILTSGATGSGSGHVGYSVTTNTSHNGRTGTILVAGRTLTATQDGAPRRCGYAISPSSRNIGAAGGAGSVTIKTSAGCAWSAQSLAGWISITGGASGIGPGTLTYTVAANTTGISRQGKLVIAGKTFAVKQSP